MQPRAVVRHPPRRLAPCGDHVLAVLGRQRLQHILLNHQVFGDVLDAVKYLAVSHHAEVLQRVAFGKTIRRDLAHFDDGRDVFARAAPLFAFRFARLPALRRFSLARASGCSGMGSPSTVSSPGVICCPKLLPHGRDLLRALAKQASVEGFDLLGEPLDELAVLGELGAKLRILLAQMRNEQARDRIERFQVVIASRHRQP